jgi:DNA repair photolyase
VVYLCTACVVHYIHKQLFLRVVKVTRSVQQWQASAVLNRSPKGRAYGFDYSLNPYRGCSHACRYCYARESHTFLNLNVAQDFEQHLFVKDNLASRLQAELPKIPQDAVIALGTVTDPYQALEGHHRLTRSAVELLRDSGHAFTITTKSPLIERDLDLLEPLAQRRQVAVHVSLISLDRPLLQRLEPGTAPPRRRLQTVRRLCDRGIPVGVFVAPIIPGLTDDPHALDALFAAIHEARATWVMASGTRLAPAIRSYFIQQVQAFDEQAAHRLMQLYGTSQMPEPGYTHALNRLVAQLCRRHRLSRSAPEIFAWAATAQLHFSL